MSEESERRMRELERRISELEQEFFSLRQLLNATVDQVGRDAENITELQEEIQYLRNLVRELSGDD